MGVCGGKASNGYGKSPDMVKNYQNSGNPSDVKFAINDLAGYNTGDITKEYTIMSPALGRGAFGEVRKAKHGRTGVVRAVKILKKKNCDEEEQRKFLAEVSILRKLVGLSHEGSSQHYQNHRVLPR